MRTTKQCVSFGSSKCKTKGEVVFCRMNACRSLQQVQNIKRCLIKDRKRGWLNIILEIVPQSGNLPYPSC